MAGNWEWILELAFAKKLIDKPCRPPSQSTLSRLCCLCDEFALKQLYLKVLRENAMNGSHNQSECVTRLPHYTIDGKSRAGCTSPTTGRTEIDLVLLNVGERKPLAWLVIPDKEGEPTCALKMFKMFGRKISRGVLTADCAFASPEFLREVRRCDHGYIIAIKGNTGKVFEVVSNHRWDSCDHRVTHNDKGHGRQEVRTLEMLPVSAFTKHRRQFKKYKDCGYVLRVTSTRTVAGTASTEVRYFIASKDLKGFAPDDFMSRIRAHWQHENNFHWVKDAVLGEDSLPRHRHKSSRLMGFLKSVVISLARAHSMPVQEFADWMLASPRLFVTALFHSG
jgi:hypothetical protein